MLSTGRIELAEVTGVEYARSIPNAPHTNGVVCFPARFPTGLPPVAAEHTTPSLKQQQPRLDRAHWCEIAQRSRYESLRALAAEYGVSHETIRGVVRRHGQGSLTHTAWGAASR